MNLYGPKQLAESMRTVRKNTIQIAQDIPEHEYGYRPTSDSRSLSEILVHTPVRLKLEENQLVSIST